LRIRFTITLFGLLLCLSCEEESKKKVVSEVNEISDVQPTAIYVCPSACENGMTYYLEGKCDICHHNLIKKED